MYSLCDIVYYSILTPSAILFLNFYFKTFGKPLAKLPLEGESKPVFSQWRIYWFNYTSVGGMEIRQTVLSVALGNTVVEIHAVGCVIKDRLTFEVI